ncbi:MAG: hypothetical protein Q4A13_05515, partial [Fretibacterium sp.]|nr:hypothetical protein [Fretibacterium sp.]
PAARGRVDPGAARSAPVDEGAPPRMPEGGARVLTSFMALGLADELALFSSHRIMGEGPGLGTGLCLEAVSDSVLLKDARTRRVGKDFLLEARFSCSPDL